MSISSCKSALRSSSSCSLLAKLEIYGAQKRRVGKQDLRIIAGSILVVRHFNVTILIGLLCWRYTASYLMENVHHYHTWPGVQQTRRHTRTHIQAHAHKAQCRRSQTQHKVTLFSAIFQMSDPSLPVPVSGTDGEGGGVGSLGSSV